MIDIHERHKFTDNDIAKIEDVISKNNPKLKKRGYDIIYLRDKGQTLSGLIRNDGFKTPEGKKFVVYVEIAIEAVLPVEHRMPRCSFSLVLTKGIMDAIPSIKDESKLFIDYIGDKYKFTERIKNRDTLLAGKTKSTKVFKYFESVDDAVNMINDTLYKVDDEFSSFAKFISKGGKDFRTWKKLGGKLPKPGFMGV